MNLFSEDNFLGQFFSKTGDIIILSLMFTLCCIPVFTIGAAWSAADYVSLERRRENDNSIVRLFFRGFRSSFRQSTIAWLINLLLIFILIVDYNTFRRGGVLENPVVLFLILVIAFLLLCVDIWLFAVIAAFENTLKVLLHNACVFMAGNILATILMSGSLIVAMLFSFSDLNVLLAVIPVWIAVGFGLYFRLSSVFLIRAFKPYIDADRDQMNLPE